MADNSSDVGPGELRTRSIADILGEPSDENVDLLENELNGDEMDVEMEEMLPLVNQENGVDVDGAQRNCSLVWKSSFHLLNGNSSPVEGNVFEATWEGGSVDDMRILAPLINQIINVNQGQGAMNRCTRDIGTSTGGGSGGGGSPIANSLTFKDCGGLEKQVSYIKTAILDPLSGKSQAGASRFGLEAPKGVLFYGPPGTGKTRLALALSNEIKAVLKKPVHFIYRKGQDVASKYLGQSSENLRAVFEEAKQKQPSLIFFDELDGLCPSRDGVNPNQACITIVTTMLGLMDELPKGKVFVIGATNRLEAIDPALRRPGRFDKHLEFLPPTETGRFHILRIHTESWKTKPDAELLRGLSQRTIGFSGADLAKLCLDTFDNALNRAVQDAGGNFQSPSLRKLNVVDQDWEQALAKMKPSNSAVFGSSLYTHPLSLGEHVSPLLESNVANIVEEVTNILPATKSLNAHSSILGLHIASDSDVILGNLGESVIPESLRSRELGHYTMYSISPATLSSIPKNKWGTRINEIFTQALESPQPSILYLQDTDQWWDMLKRAKLGYSINLKQEIERIRGKFVLLLTSGPSYSAIPADNPLKETIGIAKNYEIEPPSDDDRYNFFEPVFTLASLSIAREQIDLLQEVLDKVVDYTEDREVGSMLILHDQLKEFMLNSHGRTSSDILGTLTRIVGAYRMQQ